MSTTRIEAGALLSYLAWRVGRGFGLWHATRDNKYTLCGRAPDGLLSVWNKREPPPVEDQCSACRKRLQLEAAHGME